MAHDWGGVVAWHTAALYPDVVERLIVMGIPHPSAWNDNMDLNQARTCFLSRLNTLCTLDAPSFIAVKGAGHSESLLQLLQRV